MEIPSFNALIQKSIIDHWDMDALTDYKGATLQFHDVARKIEKLHIMFENSGVVKGDKIALCGRNSAKLGNGHFLPSLSCHYLQTGNTLIINHMTLCHDWYGYHTCHP